MKNAWILLVALVMVPATSWAAAEWKTARVVSVDVLETFPVTYDVTFESRCDDVEAKVIKVIGKAETVLGVIVKNDSTLRCSTGQPIVTVQKLRLLGEAADPSQVAILK